MPKCYSDLRLKTDACIPEIDQDLSAVLRSAVLVAPFFEVLRQRGQVFTVISNTSASPIVGSLHNPVNGKVLVVNGSNLQANHSGGDGNDLTLTVVP